MYMCDFAVVCICIYVGMACKSVHHLGEVACDGFEQCTVSARNCEKDCE